MGGKPQGSIQKQPAQLSLSTFINCGEQFLTGRAVAIQKGEITEKHKAKQKNGLL